MPTPALPIGECLAQAARHTFLRPLAALRAFWPLFCAETAGALLRDDLWRLGALSVALALAIPCACAWHRHLIAQAAPRLQLGFPEWRYLKRALLITVQLVAILLPFTFASVLLREDAFAISLAFLAAGLALATWVTAPAMLTLAAAALNLDLPAPALTALIKGNRGRLFALLFVTAAAEILLSMATDRFGASAAPARLAVTIVFWPLAVAMLSMAYVWLTRTTAASA
ncbi:MAG: hypothetical protein ACM3Q1_16765 [Bacteroidales bacterium]